MGKKDILLKKIEWESEQRQREIDNLLTRVSNLEKEVSRLRDLMVIPIIDKITGKEQSHE